MELLKKELDLQLFAGDGGAAAGADAGTGATGAVTVSDAGEAAPQDTAEESPAAEEKAPDLKAEFSELIRGKYKDEYSKSVQSIVDKRLKNLAPLRDQVAKTKPIIEILSNKYGETDLDRLAAAIEEDDSFFENEAYKMGMDVKQYKSLMKVQRENEALKAQNEQIEQQRRTQQIVEEWNKQAEEVKKTYDPNFDFTLACEENEDFLDLVKRGISVVDAYKVLHADELIANAMQITAKKVAEKTANNIQSRSNRPTEGGIGSGVINKKIDVNSLTGKDIRSIIERAEKGEKIVF